MFLASGGHSSVLPAGLKPLRCSNPYPPYTRQASQAIQHIDLPMSSPQHTRHKKTLFVDDDELVRAVMSDVLRDFGHEVVEAATAHEALALIDESIDLMITDIVLPDMSGNLLAVDIRKRFPALPIIFATGGDGSLPHGSEGVENAVMLLKPYDLASFKGALDKVGV